MPDLFLNDIEPNKTCLNSYTNISIVVVDFVLPNIP